MKKLLILSVLHLVLIPAFAQFPGGGRMGGGQNMNMGHFYGKIVDNSNKGIDAVSVQLTGKRFDTIIKKMVPAIFGTTITRANGEFSFDNLPVTSNFKLSMSAMGYKAKAENIKFDIKPTAQGGNMRQLIGMVDKDLGNIKLEEDAVNLGNVTVTSTVKPQFELGVDRKIFNVDKNLTSAGQTAAEIMKSIPTLSVDIDGNVTLRNASPQIFIDGRPTTLTLDQIPADIIDKVELITNPSAKFDASGGNAGILNIVLKKNKRIGYNGGIRAGIDSRARTNLTGDISIRQNKFNLSLAGSYYQRKSLSKSITDRNNAGFGSFPPSVIHNTVDGTSDGTFSLVRAGVDYFADNRNTFSLAATYMNGKLNSNNVQRVDSFINKVYTSYNNISTLSDFDLKNVGAQLSYKHNFVKTGHELTADVNFSSSKFETINNINTQTYHATGGTKGQSFLQRTLGNGSNDLLTIQADYENPISDHAKFEAGIRGAIRDFSNVSNQYRYNNGTDKYVLVPVISNKYKFNDQVFAAYSTYTFKTGKWNFQLGLRAESSNYTGNLITQTGVDSSRFAVNFPLSLFPSTFITYKVNDKQDIQFNYSRRVNRPNFFQLMPFPDYSDPQSISIGNAGLKPEFTNSFEVSYNNTYKSGANFLASLFFKQNTNLITRYTYQDVNALSPTNDLAYFNTYINANSSYITGLELTNRMPVTKWWDLTLNVNFFYSKINAFAAATSTTPAQTLVNDMFSWFAKMNSTFKVAKGWSVQFSGDYHARNVLSPNSGGGGSSSGGGGGRSGGGGSRGFSMGGGPQSASQGYNYPRIELELGLRKDWTWKNGQSGSVTLSMNDIFRTQVFKSYSEAPGLFTQTSERRRDQQVLRLNFTYRFGKFDANLFKRKNTKADSSGGQEMMSGGEGQ